jgi:PST family polysaccharide transporter
MDLIRRLSKDRTIRSAVGLLVLQVFTFLVPFLSLPWLARVLGAESMGVLLYWQSLALWGAMVVEYGFTLVGSRAVAQRIARTDAPLHTLSAAPADPVSPAEPGGADVLALVEKPEPHAASQRSDRALHAETASHVLSARLLLSGFVLLGMVGVWFAVPSYSTDLRLPIWAVVLAVGQGLMPSWFFRGLERLMPIVAATVISRTLSTVLTLLLVQQAEQAWLALALQALFVVAATGVTTWMLYRRVAWRAPRWGAAWQGLREAWDVFLINAASSIYGAASPFLLGLLSTPIAVAHWATAERLNRIFGNVFGTISAAAFPRISAELVRSPRTAARMATWLVVASAALSTMVAIPLAVAAPLVVQVLYGSEYAPAAQVLRILSLQLVFSSISRVLGTLWMIPMGMERALNRIVIGAGLIFLLLALFLAPTRGAWGMAIAFILAEGFIVTAQAFQIWRSGYAFWLAPHRRRLEARAPVTTLETLQT